MSNEPKALATTHQPAPLAVMVDPRAAVAPRNMDDVWDYCKAVASISLCGVRSPEEAMIRITTGMELGLTPMQSMRGVYVIEGRPALSADLMVGLCLSRSDVCESFDLVESSDSIAVYSIKRRSKPAVRFAYTIEQARVASLTDRKPWKVHPAAMLRARASSQGARAVFPDLINGLYTHDEVIDGEVISSEPVSVAAVAEVVTREPPRATPSPAPTTPKASPPPLAAAAREPAPAPAPAAPAPAPAPDWDELAKEAKALIDAATTAKGLEEMKATISKLCPKGSPHRDLIVGMLADRHEALLRAEPRENFE